MAIVFSGAKMRAILAAKGVRLESLAVLTGMGYPYLERVGADRARPSARAVGQIAEALGINPGDLFADDGTSAAIPPPEGSAPPPEMTPATAARVKALLDMRGEVPA